jgi:hypothetical protein
MIRPITIVAFLMACGSGLYLYQSKHEVQLLDRTIEKAVRDTTALREQSRLLSAEWTMLNDPDRLRQFSDTYLSLKTINPAQFTSLNDLDGRLPALRVETPEPAPIDTPVAIQIPLPAAPEPDTTAAPSVAVAVAGPDAMPLPPIPAARPVQLALPAAHPVESKVAIIRAPVVAEVKPPEQRAIEPKPAPRLAEVRPEFRAPEIKTSESRTSEPRTQVAAAAKPIVLPPPRSQTAYNPPPYNPPAYSQPVAAAAPVPTPFRPSPAPAPAPAVASAPAPYSGSLLGMARSSMPPAPRPTPVNATYNAN